MRNSATGCLGIIALLATTIAAPLTIAVGLMAFTVYAIITGTLRGIFGTLRE